jgi:anaerobic ribonucleoside-triphosphate reductase activating protein
MNFAGIIKDDVANGIGVRTSIFVSGCNIHCPGCQNKYIQDFNYGREFTDDDLKMLLDSISDDYHAGITILGGEPLDENNIEGVYNIINKFRKRYGDTKTIWLYTGYIYEFLKDVESIEDKYIDLVFNNIDVLIDGPFIQDKRDITLKFRGSSNQRIIDMKKTIETGDIILMD